MHSADDIWSSFFIARICGCFYLTKGVFMSDIWDGTTWNENGELVLDIYAEPPVAETDEELEEYEEDSEEFEHTYATVDCGGECGGCVALIVDGVVVSGPPFHPHCGCSLSPQDIRNAKQHKSNLHGSVAPDRNVDTRDIEWLKKSLTQLDCYEPDTRAGESAENPNPYPNQKLFDAIEKFRKLQKIKERGAVKPGHWTEVKINQELEKKQSEKNDMKNILTDKFKNDVMAHEGIRKSPYTDSKGYLTIGIGKNIHKLNDFLKLDIINTNTGTELTEVEKQNIHSKMVSEINNGTFREYDYAHIQISPNQIYNQFNQQLEIAYNELNKKITNFIDMPTPIQQALVDMQFNMGNSRFSERYWPKLFEAIKNKDWETAAKEASERKDVQKARREWTKRMFLKAN